MLLPALLQASLVNLKQKLSCLFLSKYSIELCALNLILVDEIASRVPVSSPSVGSGNGGDDTSTRTG